MKLKSNDLIKVRHEIVDFKPKLILEIDKEALQDITTLHGWDAAKESLILALNDFIEIWN
jgi:hypothetical protein